MPGYSVGDGALDVPIRKSRVACPGSADDKYSVAALEQRLKGKPPYQ